MGFYTQPRNRLAIQNALRQGDQQSVVVKRRKASSKVRPAPWECSHASKILKCPKFKPNEDLSSQNVCYICGRICPSPIADCDAVVSIEKIELHLGEFAKQATPTEVAVFADYVCRVLKNIIGEASNEYLETVITKEDCQGLKYFLIAEASKRREEITDWEPIIDPGVIVLVQLYPVNFSRAVSVRVIQIVPGLEDKNED